MGLRDGTAGVRWRALWRSCLLVWRAAPSELRRLVLLNLIVGAGPAVLLLLGKVVIDEVAGLVGDGSGTGTVLSQPVLLWSVAGFVAINVLLDSVETLAAFELSSLGDRVQGSVRAQIYEKVAEFDDIALFENPEMLNTLRLAEGGIPRLQRLTATINNSLHGVFLFVPVLVLSLSIAWWVAPVIFLSAAPSVWAQLRHEELGWNVEHLQAGRRRLMDLHARVLTGPEYAREIRLFRLQPFLLGRWRGLFWSTYEQMRLVRRRGALVVTGWSLLSGLGAGLPYAYVVVMAADGAYTLGDLALYAGLVFQVRQSLFMLIGNAADLQDIALGSSAIYRLLDLRSSLHRTPAPEAVPAGSPGDPPVSIRVRGVAFSYPGSERTVLEDVDLDVDPGQTVVIVGENGAGKTTLSKLLCRFYDPQEGSILWDGEDVRTLDLDALRDRVGFVGQDYARFPASARENIAFGLLARLEDDGEILRAAGRAGIREPIQSFPHGLDTPLSRQLDEGIELSGGQWQRVALARALLRSPRNRLLVLDEPTAALDARAEHEMLKILEEMARGKTAVIISHRLSLARKADKIVVMERGRVVEIGTHEQLMETRGRYHEMFRRQASSFI